jgi:hypothetical protein
MWLLLRPYERRDVEVKAVRIVALELGVLLQSGSGVICSAANVIARR